jgi:flagellar capping protein FliD
MQTLPPSSWSLFNNMSHEPALGRTSLKLTYDPERHLVLMQLDTGSGTNRYRLQVKGNTTGTANGFDVTPPASLTLDTNTNVTFAASDASFTVDGVALTRSSNTVSDAISGVTLTLKSKTVTAATFTVNNDTATMQANIKALFPPTMMCDPTSTCNLT